MIYVARSKISGRGVFTDRLIRPGRPVNDAPVDHPGFNHSCEPNCIIVRDPIGWHGGCVIALRFITKGEELTLDYRTASRRRLHPLDVMKRPPRDCRPCKCSACKRTK